MRVGRRCRCPCVGWTATIFDACEARCCDRPAWCQYVLRVIAHGSETHGRLHPCISETFPDHSLLTHCLPPGRHASSFRKPRHVTSRLDLGVLFSHIFQRISDITSAYLVTRFLKGHRMDGSSSSARKGLNLLTACVSVCGCARDPRGRQKGRKTTALKQPPPTRVRTVGRWELKTQLCHSISFCSQFGGYSIVV